MIGCALMVGAVGFFFGLIGALFASEASVAERLMIAAIAFVAAIVVSLWHQARYKAGENQHVGLRTSQ